jgi:hypothetical protein
MHTVKAKASSCSRFNNVRRKRAHAKIKAKKQQDNNAAITVKDDITYAKLETLNGF